MQPETVALRAYLSVLNRDADIAATADAAFRKARVEEWGGVLRSHPEWAIAATMEALLSWAHEELDNDLGLARAITTFVLDHAAAVGAEGFRRPLLLGMTWKETASVYYAQGHYSAALHAAEQALQVLHGHPVLVVDHAVALLVYAQAAHEIGETVQALDALDRAAAVFRAHAQPRRELQALEVSGQILMDQHEYLLAQEIYTIARATAEMLDDTRELVRADQNLGVCAMRLGALDDASLLLRKAFAGFERERMRGELHRTIWALAQIARERDELDEAIAALHRVYAEFLDRGMIRLAASVLVELGDTVTQLTGDPAYAREMCPRLVDTLRAHDVTPNLLDAVTYLARETQRIPAVDHLCAVFARVASFLEDLVGSPLMAFAPTMNAI